MEVSSFELIYKPQSPSGAADIVLQGYFLNIANLEEVELQFRLDFVTSPVTDPDRSLNGNTIVFIDGPDANNQSGNLIGGLTAKSFRLSPLVTVPAHGTAKVAVLPSDPFPMPSGPPDFEARGYVTIRLPALFVGGGGFFGNFQAQLDRPAKVLLTPQNRATYFDAEGTINDQTQSSLPTASGGALAEVEAERFGFFEPVLPGRFGGLLERVGPERFGDLSYDDLAMMLGAIAASDVDLKTLNAELKAAGIGMALETRKI